MVASYELISCFINLSPLLDTWCSCFPFENSATFDANVIVKNLSAVYPSVFMKITLHAFILPSWYSLVIIPLLVDCALSKDLHFSFFQLSYKNIERIHIICWHHIQKLKRHILVVTMNFLCFLFGYFLRTFRTRIFLCIQPPFQLDYWRSSAYWLET